MGGGNENERRRDVQKAYKKRVRGRSRILLEQISALVPKQDGGGGLRRVHEILRDTLVFAKHILKRDQKTIIECLSRLETARRVKGHLDPMERISLDDISHETTRPPVSGAATMGIDIQTTLHTKAEPHYPPGLDVLSRNIHTGPGSFQFRPSMQSPWDFSGNLNSAEGSKIASPASPTRGGSSTPYTPSGAGLVAPASSSMPPWLGLPAVGLKSSGSGERIQDLSGSSTGAGPGTPLASGGSSQDLKVQQARYVQNLIETAKAMLHGPASGAGSHAGSQAPAHQALYSQLPVPSTTAAPSPGQVGAVQTHLHHQPYPYGYPASPRPTVYMPSGLHPNSPLGAVGSGGGVGQGQVQGGGSGSGSGSGWVHQASEVRTLKPQSSFDASTPIGAPQFLPYHHGPAQQ